MLLAGEATEDELFSRLQQIKDGPEQQNNTPRIEREEDPVGMFTVTSFLFFYFFVCVCVCGRAGRLWLTVNFRYDLSLVNSAYF